MLPPPSNAHPRLPNHVPRYRRSPEGARTLGLACGLVILASCGPRSKQTERPAAAPETTAAQQRDGDFLLISGEAETLRSGQPAPVLDWLGHELEHNLARLQSTESSAPPYFMGYELVTSRGLWIEAQLGQIVRDQFEEGRTVDVDVRVGSPELDNSRVRSGDYGQRGLGSGVTVSLDDDRLSLAQSLWMITEAQYKDARAAYEELLNEESRRSEIEEGGEGLDFSPEPVLDVVAPVPELVLQAGAELWRGRLQSLSARMADASDALESSASISIEHELRQHRTTEGTRLQLSSGMIRLSLAVEGQADDGMALARMQNFDVRHLEQLPAMNVLEQAADQLVGELRALKAAPIAEPYTGPAVLEGPAAGVFFHEIFGHRLEGHRQKSDDEGQTFTDMVGQRVLPRFLQVVDDPTIARLDGVPLMGHYFVDNEGVAAQRTALVDRGVLREFLFSRSLIPPFEHSNGHGRRALGHPVVARQGNLIINSSRSVPESQLRAKLIEMAKKAGKPYGLWFRDIDGGFTTTSRSGPQAFKVIPRIVFRVWTDGRPDELVRGVDIVGTPLSAFETIELTGDRPGIFNGMCGAESGWVPVSAVSPSLLVSKLEIERAAFDRERPPLLAPPFAVSERGGTEL